MMFSEKYPEEVGGIRTLGYLLTVTMRDGGLIPRDEYNTFIEQLAQRRGLDEETKKMLKPPSCRAAKAFQTALKEFEKESDDPRRGERWFIRYGHGSKRLAGTPKFLVREQYTKGKTLNHAVCARLTYSTEKGISVTYMTDACGWVTTGQTKLGVERIKQLFTQEYECFAPRLIKGRIRSLLSLCKPLQYDSEHKFSFIHADEKNKLLALEDIIEFVNRYGEGKSRSSRSSIATLAIPDREYYRGALLNAFQEEMAETIEAVRSAVDEYKKGAGELPEDKRLNLLKSSMEKMSKMQGKAKYYEQYALASVEETRKALSQMQQETRRLIGVETVENKPGCNRFPAMSKAAKEFHGRFLAAEPRAAMVFARWEVLAWQRGHLSEAEVLFCQDDLDREGKVRLTFEKRPNEEISKLDGVFTTRLGICYEGAVTDELIHCLVRWWNTEEDK